MTIKSFVDNYASAIVVYYVTVLMDDTEVMTLIITIKIGIS